MKPYKHIMVALDFSTIDEKLLNRIKELAGALKGGRITIVHVFPSVMIPELAVVGVEKEGLSDWQFAENVQQEVQQEVQHLLADQVQHLDGVEVVAQVVRGKPHRELLHLVDQHNPDLVVVGKKVFPHGSGITAKRLARYHRGDVLIVPESMTGAVRRILVAIDFSPFSWKALSKALAIRKQLGESVKVIAYHVVDVPRNYVKRNAAAHDRLIQRMMAQARQSYLQFKYSYDFDENQMEMIIEKATERNVTAAILDGATVQQANMIVVGAQGHSLVENDHLGSVAENLLDYCSERTLLIVR